MMPSALGGLKGNAGRESQCTNVSTPPALPPALPRPPITAPRRAAFPCYQPSLLPPACHPTRAACGHPHLPHYLPCLAGQSGGDGRWCWCGELWERARRWWRLYREGGVALQEESAVSAYMGDQWATDEREPATSSCFNSNNSQSSRRI